MRSPRLRISLIRRSPSAVDAPGPCVAAIAPGRPKWHVGAPRPASSATAKQSEPAYMRNFHFAGRSTVHARNGMVATSHPLAALTAIEVLKSGGTAADAAGGACALLGGVEPQTTRIGGGRFFPIQPPGEGGGGSYKRPRGGAGGGGPRQGTENKK